MIEDPATRQLIAYALMAFMLISAVAFYIISRRAKAEKRRQRHRNWR